MTPQRPEDRLDETEPISEDLHVPNYGLVLFGVVLLAIMLLAFGCTTFKAVDPAGRTITVRGAPLVNRTSTARISWIHPDTMVVESVYYTTDENRTHNLRWSRSSVTSPYRRARLRLEALRHEYG